MPDDQGNYAYTPPTQQNAYGPSRSGWDDPPLPLPGITSGAPPEPWGMRDRDRGTPLEQVPETPQSGSGFVDTINRVRRGISQYDQSDQSMERSPTTRGYPVGPIYGGSLPTNRPRDI